MLGRRTRDLAGGQPAGVIRGDAGTFGAGARETDRQTDRERESEVMVSCDGAKDVSYAGSDIDKTLGARDGESEDTEYRRVILEKFV